MDVLDVLVFTGGPSLIALLITYYSITGEDKKRALKESAEVPKLRSEISELGRSTKRID